MLTLWFVVKVLAMSVSLLGSIFILLMTWGNDGTWASRLFWRASRWNPRWVFVAVITLTSPVLMLMHVGERVIQWGRRARRTAV